MGKSNKKSAPVVAAEPTSKSAKKGKRDVEEVLEKQVNGKKLKSDEATQKKKGEAKTAIKNIKKKVDTSSSDESDSEQEEMVVQTKQKVETKKPLKKETSSSEDSSSDSEEEPAPKKQPLPSKNGTVASLSSDDESDEDEKKAVLKELSSDESESDSSSDEETDKNKGKVQQKQPVAVAKSGSVTLSKKDESTDSSEEESSDSDEEDEPAKITSQNKKAPAMPAKTAIKKDESSDESEETDSDSDEDESSKKPVSVVPKKKAESSDDSSDSESEEEEVDAKNGVKKPANIVAKKEASHSNSEDQEDSSSDDDGPPVKNAVDVSAKRPRETALTKETQQGKMDVDESDSEEEDSSEESDEEPQKKKPKIPVNKSNGKISKKESSSDEETTDDSDEDSDDEPKTTSKKDADADMVDASPAVKEVPMSDKKAPKTPVTPQGTGSKTIFVGNLSYSVEKADVENFFQAAGEVQDVRFAVDADDRFKGFCHVEFTTAEAAQKAVEYNGEYLNDRQMRISLAHERGAYTPQSGKGNFSSQKGGRGQGQTLFVKGLDKSLGEDQLRSSLKEHFGTCGDISRISIPTDHESGEPKGFAYIDFSDSNSSSKALELNGTELGGYPLTVDEPRPRGDSGGFDGGRGGGRSGGRSSGGGRFSGRGGGRFDRGRGGGRFDRGRGGGRFGGRGRGTPNRPSMAASGTGKKTTFGDD